MEEQNDELHRRLRIAEEELKRYELEQKEKEIITKEKNDRIV